MTYSAVDKLPRFPSGRTGWPWTAPADSPPEQGDWPRITLVTPSYNQGGFIEETLRSVLLQGYPNLEYIVIDGGSTDGSVEVIKRYEPHLSHWVSESDRGQSHAINKGIAAGSGEVVGWLCSDDLLAPGALWAIGRHFADHPDCQWLAGRGDFVSVDTGQVKRRRAGMDSPTALMAFWNYGGRGSYLPQPSTFWRRSLWDQVEGLREENHLSMDYELWLRFEERTDLHVIDDVLSVSRLHADCKTVGQRREQVREMMQCAYDAATRRGFGQWRLTCRMLNWLIRRHLARGRQQWQARCWKGAYWELASLIRQSKRVWDENGRLSLLKAE